MRFLELVGRRQTKLGPGPGHEVVDATDQRVLKVVLVPAEHRLHPGALPERDQPVHGLRVVMLWTRAEWRVVAEGNPPDRSSRRGKCRVQEILMLRVVDQAFGENRFFGRVEAHELDVRSIPKAVEHARLERRAARGLLAGDPLPDIEVVFDLSTIVVVFAFAGVVITDRRVDADPVEDIPVGLKVA